LGAERVAGIPLLTSVATRQPPK